METKTYQSYSSNFKLAAINGELITANYHSQYYWKNKGKLRIEAAAKTDGTFELLKDRLDVNIKINNACSSLCEFFMQFVQAKKATIKQFKKQRATIITIIDSLKSFVDIFTICKWFGITERTYYNWKNKPICKQTITQECPNTITTQLSQSERTLLETNYFFNETYNTRSVSELYAQMLADKYLIISESLFYEMARYLGEDIKRNFRKKNEIKIGIRAELPKQIVHLDKTKFKIIADLKSRAWVSLICDNRSRAILAHTVSFSSKSSVTLDNLKQAIHTHQLLDQKFMLLTDDGSENKGDVKTYINQNPNINHKIAQVDIDFSNSMIESVIKQLKYRYLLKKEFNTIDELIIAIGIAIELYNNRPRKILLGKTPLQVLNGNTQCPIELDLLKQEFRKKRIDENREFKCLRHTY